MAKRRPPRGILKGSFVISKRPGSTMLAEDGPMAFFSTKERKKIWIDSMAAAAYGWVAKYLGKRFSNYVNRAPFSYTGGKKGKDPRPLVDSGVLKQQVGSGVKIKITGTAAKGSTARVTFPTTPYASGKINRVLGTVASWEVDGMAKDFEETAAEMINGSVAGKRGKLALAGGE